MSTSSRKTTSLMSSSTTQISSGRSPRPSMTTSLHSGRVSGRPAMTHSTGSTHADLESSTRKLSAMSVTSSSPRTKDISSNRSDQNKTTTRGTRTSQSSTKPVISSRTCPKYQDSFETRNKPSASSINPKTEVRKTSGNQMRESDRKSSGAAAKSIAERVGSNKKAETSVEKSTIKTQPRPKPSAAFLKAHGLKPDGRTNSPEDALFHLEKGTEKLHPKIVQQARQSGQLNLSGRGLVAVPAKVWTICDLDDTEQKAMLKNASIDKVSDDDAWWNSVDLVKLILACNKLSCIPGDIGNLEALSILDIHDNCIEVLPNEIRNLTNLMQFNASHNKIQNLPDDFFNLCNLRQLDLSNNELTVLSEEISGLNMLEKLDLSHNRLRGLPYGIGYLTNLTHLRMNHNLIQELPSEIGFLKDLKTLEAVENKLEDLPDSMSELKMLECLYLRHNQLKNMPNLRNCVHLKEIHLGNNKIAKLTIEDIENIPNVSLIDLKNNKLSEIPDEIISLKALERLDFSNNDLSNVPYSLGTLSNLKSLSIDGNPIKTIRRDIIQRGTIELLKYLRSRLTKDEVKALEEQISPRNSHSSNASSVPDMFSMRHANSLNMSSKELRDLPEEAVKNASEAQVQSVDLSKNQFTEVPNSLEYLMGKLQEMNMSQNRLTRLPVWLGLGTSLQYINFSSNKLSELPGEMSSLPYLREVNLSFNRFQEIPPCLYSCLKLETIIINDNQVLKIDVPGLEKLKSLAVLDLHNNNIDSVPPELGLLTQLRCLQLEGNAFRIPRPQILAKGTETVMSYLRDRIPKESS